MFKKLTDDARLPERATRYSAGFDVFANEDVVIGAGETKLIGLGIAIDMEQIKWLFYKADIQKKEDGEHHKTEKLDNNLMNKFLESHYFALHIRSSLRAKGLTSLGTGIIDMDFTQEIKIVIHNPAKIVCYTNVGGAKLTLDFDDKYEIKKGDKIGQLILCRHEGYLLPSEYTKDEERSGGFGSTGK